MESVHEDYFEEQAKLRELAKWLDQCADVYGPDIATKIWVILGESKPTSTK